MPLHLTHRPKSLEQFQGNRTTVQSLGTILKRESDRPHAFLFTGNSGCGKTTLGRIVASSLGCAEVDLKEVDSADFRGIDSIREIRSQSRLKPMAGDVRVWLLDEVHKLTNDAQNALLKILEDTPAHVYFILCTTDPEKLLKTVKSRCMEFQVAPLSDREMVKHLKNIISLEDVKDFPEEAYQALYESSFGHVRAAMVMLDKIIDLPPRSILKSIEKAASEESVVFNLCKLLLKKASWKEVGTLLQNLPEGTEEEGVRRLVLKYMTTVLMKENNVQAAITIEAFKEPFFNSGKAGFVLACYDSIIG